MPMVKHRRIITVIGLVLIATVIALCGVLIFSCIVFCRGYRNVRADESHLNESFVNGIVFETEYAIYTSNVQAVRAILTTNVTKLPVPATVQADPPFTISPSFNPEVRLLREVDGEWQHVHIRYPGRRPNNIIESENWQRYVFEITASSVFDGSFLPGRYKILVEATYIHAPRGWMLDRGVFVTNDGERIVDKLPTNENRTQIMRQMEVFIITAEFVIR